MPRRDVGLRRAPEGSTITPPGSILITGASGGIGRALSLLFGTSGWFVGLHYHDGKASAESTLRRIEAAGGAGAVYQADVRDLESVQQMVTAFCRASVRPASLVCAAGIGRSMLLLQQQEDDWMNVLATNLTGVFYCLKAMAPPLLGQGGGSMIVVGSYAGYQGSIGQAAYAASKAGLIGLVKTAALEWGPDNIRVNLVLPGWQNTALTKGKLPMRWEDHVLHRPPVLKEVARTVLHLIQEHDVSGQVWNCDSRNLF